MPLPGGYMCRSVMAAPLPNGFGTLTFGVVHGHGILPISSFSLHLSLNA